MIYKLCRLLSRDGKDGKKYNFAHLIMLLPNDTELIKVYITEKQMKALQSVPNDFDINKYVSVDYNTYKKVYEPHISYGL